MGTHEVRVRRGGSPAGPGRRAGWRVTVTDRAGQVRTAADVTTRRGAIVLRARWRAALARGVAPDALTLAREAAGEPTGTLRPDLAGGWFDDVEPDELAG